MRLVGMALSVAALALAGCATTEPINNVLNAPLSYPQDKPLSQSEVQRAIIDAGKGLGWAMQTTGPGRVTGRLMLRSHVAEIDIEHNAKTYSIQYRDSQNLDARDGLIHKQYNHWVVNLDKAIQAQVNNAASFK
jgi:hypothetical protein